MTGYFLFWVGLFLTLAGVLIFTVLVVSYLNRKHYDRSGGSVLHPRWLYRDTTGSVYSSRNDRPS